MPQNLQPNTKRTPNTQSLVHLHLGIFGLSLWLFISFALFIGLLLVIWRTATPPIFASSSGQNAQVAGLFGVIPEFASSIGFTHGLADERAKNSNDTSSTKALRWLGMRKHLSVSQILAL